MDFIREGQQFKRMTYPIAWLEKMELAKSKLATGKFTLAFRGVGKSEASKIFAMVR